MARKVIISFPDEFLVEVDRIARKEHRSRSELIRKALRLYIGLGQDQEQPGAKPRVRQAVMVQDKLSKAAPGTGQDSTAEIRQWRDGRINEPLLCPAR